MWHHSNLSYPFISCEEKKCCDYVNTDIFQLIKFVSKPLASLHFENAHLACLGYLGQCDSIRNDPICDKSPKQVSLLAKLPSVLHHKHLFYLLCLVLWRKYEHFYLCQIPQGDQGQQDSIFMAQICRWFCQQTLPIESSLLNSNESLLCAFLKKLKKILLKKI